MGKNSFRAGKIYVVRPDKARSSTVSTTPKSAFALIGFHRFSLSPPWVCFWDPVYLRSVNVTHLCALVLCHYHLFTLRRNFLVVVAVVVVVLVVVVVVDLEASLVA